MSKTSRSAPKLTAQQVLDALARSPVPADKRSLLRQLRLKGDGKRALTLLLRDMMRAGTVVNVGEGRIARADSGGGKEAVPLEIVGTDIEDGTLLAKPLEWIGPPPLARLRVPADHAAPSVGAHGLGKFEFVDGEWTATLVRLAERAVERVVGQIEKAGAGWRLRPTDRRVKTDFSIDANSMGEAQPGELVLAEVTPQRRLGLPQVRIVERIGRLGDPRSASLIAIHAQGIPTEFAPEVLAQAAQAKPAPLGDREDLRGRPIVTIDGADARDFDDAVLAEADSDPENPDGWRLIVAIADVSWYVRPGDALDRSAYERGNSCYFPDRVVPMLPERLSNDLCSLRPDEDRPTLAVHIVIDRHGVKRSHRFVRAMIRSAQRFTYERIQSIADGHEKAPGWIMDKVVKPLYGAYKVLVAARLERGALDLDVEERKVELGADGKVAKIAPRARLDSHKLIEEFMILANVCAAETLERKRVPCMYRVHEPPAVDRIEVLREVLRGVGAAPRARRRDATPRFRPHPRLGPRPAVAPYGQPDGAAQPVARGLRAVEPGAFRTVARALCALHLADPPLCRPARPSRAGLGREARRRWGCSRRNRFPISPMPATTSRRPSGAPCRPSATRWRAISPHISKIGRARLSLRAYRACRNSACSSRWTKSAPTGSSPCARCRRISTTSTSVATRCRAAGTARSIPLASKSKSACARSTG